jgi:hypothetical protein
MLLHFLYFLPDIHSPQFVSQSSCNALGLRLAAYQLFVDALAEKIADMINNGK